MYTIETALKDMKDAKVLAVQDPELAHITADTVLKLALKVLTSNQSEEVQEQVKELISTFNSIDKWYA